MSMSTSTTLTSTPKKGADPAALDELESAGYDVVRWRQRNLFFGGASGSSRTPATARWRRLAIPSQEGMGSSSRPSR